MILTESFDEELVLGPDEAGGTTGVIESKLIFTSILQISSSSNEEAKDDKEFILDLTDSAALYEAPILVPRPKKV